MFAHSVSDSGVFASEDKSLHRLQAVLVLLSGEPSAQVAARFRISRSDLYKFRRRALNAMALALADRRRGPRLPHNCLSQPQQTRIAAVCARHPTVSSYQISKRLGAAAVSPRTIQRLRQRLKLPRLPKRAAPQHTAKHLSLDEQRQVRILIRAKPYLGSQRLSWDLQNQYGISVSPSTFKRIKRRMKEKQHPLHAPVEWRFYQRKHPHSLWHGDYLEKVTLSDTRRTAYQLTLQDDYSRAYVFCDLFTDPDVTTTIYALCCAMRQWRTIPQAVVFDNGPNFKGKLLQAFCRNLDIRLIHSSVNHPQTNGKLERAFRDDMNEFYKQRAGVWLLDPLRDELPDYIHYRNYIRGHQALNGKPSITRLREQHFFALPSVLDRLETFAECEVKGRRVPRNGCFNFLGRPAYISRRLAGRQVRAFQTYYGLELQSDDGGRYLLRDARRYKQQSSYPYLRRVKLPKAFRFVPVTDSECPRIAVAP